MSNLLEELCASESLLKSLETGKHTALRNMDFNYSQMSNISTKFMPDLSKLSI